MAQLSLEKPQQDQKIFSSLLGEIACFQELLQVLENEPVSEEEAFGFISGIQRDIVELYRTVQA